METDPKKLGIAFKRSRLNAGMTQDKLATTLGTTRRRIGRLEKGDPSTIGETPEERFAVAAQIAAATGDLSLIDMERPEDRSELLSLRRDVDRALAGLRQLGESLVAQGLVPRSELPLRPETPDATDLPQPQGRGASGANRHE